MFGSFEEPLLMGSFHLLLKDCGFITNKEEIDKTRSSDFLAGIWENFTIPSSGNPEDNIKICMEIPVYNYYQTRRSQGLL